MVLKNPGSKFYLCRTKKKSEKSMKRLLQAHVPKEKLANLGMAILEFADLTDGINIFCRSVLHFGRGISNNFESQ